MLKGYSQILFDAAYLNRRTATRAR